MVDTAEFERDLLARIVQNIKPSKAAIFSGQNYQMSVSHGVETDQNELNMELVEKVVQTEGPVSDKVHKRQLAVPYKNADGKILGVMYVEIAAPRRLKFRDLAILQGLGRQMVEKHWQPSQDAESSLNPETMGEVTRYVRSTLSIVSSVLKPQRVLILLRLEDGPRIVASRGFDDVKDLSAVPFSRELVDSIWEKGETCHIRDALNDPQYSKFAGVKEHSLRSVCVCPLNKLDGEDRGLIYLDSCKDPAEFLTAEVSILQRLALALEKDLARVLAPEPEMGAGDVLGASSSGTLDNDHEYSLPEASSYADDPDSFVVHDSEEPEAPSEAESVTNEFQASDLFEDEDEEFEPASAVIEEEELGEETQEFIPEADEPEGEEATEPFESAGELEEEASGPDEEAAEVEVQETEEGLEMAEELREENEEARELAEEVREEAEESQQEAEAPDEETSEPDDRAAVLAPAVGAEEFAEETDEPVEERDEEAESFDVGAEATDAEESAEVAEPVEEAEETEEPLEEAEELDEEAEQTFEDSESAVQGSEDEEEPEQDDAEEPEAEPTVEQNGDPAPPPLLGLYDGSPLDGGAEYQYEPSENDLVTITLPPEVLDGSDEEDSENDTDSDEIEPTVEETAPTFHGEVDSEVESVRALPVDATVEVSADIAARALAGALALQEQQELEDSEAAEDEVDSGVDAESQEVDEPEDEEDDLKSEEEATEAEDEEEFDEEDYLESEEDATETGDEEQSELEDDAVSHVGTPGAESEIDDTTDSHVNQPDAETEDVDEAEEPEAGDEAGLAWAKVEAEADDDAEQGSETGVEEDEGEPKEAKDDEVDFESEDGPTEDEEESELENDPVSHVGEDSSEEVVEAEVPDADNEVDQESEEDEAEADDQEESDDEIADEDDLESEEDAAQAEHEEEPELEDDAVSHLGESDAESVALDEVDESDADNEDDGNDLESEEDATQAEREEESELEDEIEAEPEEENDVADDEDEDDDEGEEDDSEVDEEELEQAPQEAESPPAARAAVAPAKPPATDPAKPPAQVAEQEESLMKYVERGLQAVTPAKNASFFERLKWVFSPKSVPQGGDYSHIHIAGKVVLQDNDWKGDEPIEVTLAFPSHKMTVILEIAKGESDYAYHGRFEGESPVWFEVTVEKPGYFPIKLSKVTFQSGDVDAGEEPSTRVHEITLIPRD